MSGKRKDMAADSVSLPAVRPLWLKIDEEKPENNYLLLEDLETGDVLMPLIHMKAVFEANYSRKLSSLKNRLVVLPDDESDEEDPQAESGLTNPMISRYRYWRWAFESPHEVKVLVRKTLGEDNAPTGHLRLVLLPIVYNALSQKAELRQTALFKHLHQVMKLSKYYPLVKQPPADEDALIGTEIGTRNLLFAGPANLNLSKDKYMQTYQEASGDAAPPPASKRSNTDASPVLASGSSDVAGPSNENTQKLWEAHQAMQLEMRAQLSAISRDLGQLSEAVALLSQHIIKMTSNQQHGLYQGGTAHHGPPPGTAILPPSLTWMSGGEGSLASSISRDLIFQQPSASIAPAAGSSGEHISHPLSLRFPSPP